MSYEENTPNILKLSCLAILLLCSSLLVGCKVVLPNSYFKARGKKRKKSWLIMVLRERSKLSLSKRCF